MTLRLLAEDAEDLAVISAHCQDAVIPLNDMAYLPDQRRFLLVASRFRWEAAPEAQEDGQLVWSRVHSVLRIDHVANVRLRGFELKDRRRVLELLSIRPCEGGLLFDFAGEPALRLDLDRLQLALEDYGEPWPTSHCPAHDEAP